MSSGKTYSLTGLRGEPWTKSHFRRDECGAGHPRKSQRRSIDAAVAARLLQLVARPKDGPLGARVESFGIEQRPLVVIAQQADAARLDHQIEAFTRVGPVTDNVAQAEDFFDALRADVGEHGLERFQVAVNIADNGPFQFTARLGGSTFEMPAAPASVAGFAGNPVV